MAPKVITEEQKQEVQDMVARAKVALDSIKDYDQARVDRLCQALGWAVANEKPLPVYRSRASTRAAWRPRDSTE